MEPCPLLPILWKGTLKVRVEVEAAVLEIYPSLDRLKFYQRMPHFDKDGLCGRVSGDTPEDSSILIRKSAG
jgi:hypothetical protein